MDTQSTHTKHSRQRRYVPGSSRGSRSATTLLAQVADVQRGDRIKERREELHLTQPAVVELMEQAAWQLPRTHDLHPEKASKAPITLRGLQTYEQGGGIVWEKAKLLASVLQMDVQEMMHGPREQTPTPFPADDPQAALTGILSELRQVLGDIKQQLAEQTEVLHEIKGMLGKDSENAGRIEAANESLGGTAAQLDAAVQQVIQSLQASPPRKLPAARKTVPNRTRRASKPKPA